MHFAASEALPIASFKEMDALAVKDYELPIELMMENAGLMLAKMVAQNATKMSGIAIGVGNGNNGGGGLVAARRLAGWGYAVSLDIPMPITKSLPKIQLERAKLFGVTIEAIFKPDIWVDAYLGFSQRLPLSAEFASSIKLANASQALKISLDLPTGISSEGNQHMFQANKVITLAAPKLILNTLPLSTEVNVADIGIPKTLYKKFGIEVPLFYDHKHNKV